MKVIFQICLQLVAFILTETVVISNMVTVGGIYFKWNSQNFKTEFYYYVNITTLAYSPDNVNPTNRPTN